MEDSHDVIGTYNDLKKANEHAVWHLLVGGFWLSADEEAEVEVMEGGMISCAVQTDGSTGGFTTIFVRQAKR